MNRPADIPRDPEGEDEILEEASENLAEYLPASKGAKKQLLDTIRGFLAEKDWRKGMGLNDLDRGMGREPADPQFKAISLLEFRKPIKDGKKEVAVMNTTGQDDIRNIYKFYEVSGDIEVEKFLPRDYSNEVDPETLPDDEVDWHLVETTHKIKDMHDAHEEEKALGLTIFTQKEAQDLLKLLKESKPFS